MLTYNEHKVALGFEQSYVIYIDLCTLFNVWTAYMISHKCLESRSFTSLLQFGMLWNPFMGLLMVEVLRTFVAYITYKNEASKGYT